MTTSISVEQYPPHNAQLRRVPISQPLVWLDRAWSDLRGIGLPGIAHGVLIALLGAVLLMLGSTHLYLTAAAVTGYLLVGPIMTTGLCELARRFEARETLTFDASLLALGRNPEGLLHFGYVLGLIALLWFAVSAVLLQSAFSAPTPSLAVIVWGGSEMVTSRQVLGYVLCGGVLAAIVFSVSVVAVPLIIDRHARASEAMAVSLRACMKNLPAMLLWAGLIVGLTVIGFVTFLLGMVILAPLLGYATWHAYRDLIESA